MPDETPREWYARLNAGREAETRAIDHALAILKARGIALDIYGCGCCDSPLVKIMVDGVEVLDIEDRSISSYPDPKEDGDKE